MARFEDLDLRIDAHTALPFLRLLAALDRREDSLDFGYAWSLLKRFMAFPVTGEDLGATFQVQWPEEGTGFEVFLGRQIRSDDPEYPGLGFEEEGIFGVYLYFELDERPEPLELWSADFQDFESFVQAVERDGAAQLCVRSDSVLGYFHGQYPE